MKNKPIVSLLALSTLFFAMILPPEAYPNGKMAVVISATFVFLIALSEAQDRCIVRECRHVDFRFCSCSTAS